LHWTGRSRGQRLHCRAARFHPYRIAHVDALVSRGGGPYRAVASDAAQIEARYGVPASILLGIWGNETDFGSFQGNFDLARSLATLAYEGRRRALFEGDSSPCSKWSIRACHVRA
jgi:membrane-bound lytic murein transglycosylase B